MSAETIWSRFDRWLDLAGAGQLDEAVVAYTETYDYVTFAELQRRLEAFMPTTGEVEMSLGHPNLVVWSGMSDAFCDLLEGLLKERRLHCHPSCPWTYLMDGGLLKLPVAKRVPRAGYKKPHWLPVCLRVVPLPCRVPGGATSNKEGPGER